MNDNCPILPRVSYSFVPVPPLVQAAFFVIKATDLDSNENARISYYPQRIEEMLVLGSGFDLHDHYHKVNHSDAFILMDAKSECVHCDVAYHYLSIGFSSALFLFE